MERTRRKLLQSTGTVLTTVAIAGCSGGDDDEQPDITDEETPAPTETPEQTDSSADESTEPALDATDIGVVAEWNAMRTRLRDPVILGHAEEYSTGVSVVEDIFERFETASGEHNAHETLEATSKTNYERFEEALGQLGNRLEAKDLEGAHEKMRLADKQLRQAQAMLTDKQTVRTLSVLVMGAHVEDATILLAAGDFEDAAMEFSHIGTKFEQKGLYQMVGDADADAADRFLEALDRAASAAESEDKSSATTAANEAFSAATQGVHALAADDIAGPAHMAALQGRGWDGATVARLGGPSRSFAHAATLNKYRARARDAVVLFDAGNREAATAVVRDVLKRFETARAHDALEAADKDAYESFEGGLESLVAGMEAADASAVDEALATVDSGLRSGLSALVSKQHHALLEAGYAKIRLEDAVEQYRLGDQTRAAKLAQGVLADFEADAGTFHETLEETDQGLYDTFEHDHLEGLLEALQADEEDAVDNHIAGIRETLLQFETAVASTPAVSAVESGYVAARASDAAVLATLGETDRADEVLTQAFGHFEAGAGGFHEALEAADNTLYEEFESTLSTLQSQVSEGSTPTPGPFLDSAADAAYTVVADGGGASGEAAPVVSDVFSHFEEAAVHDLLETADKAAYESFEKTLQSYIGALESGDGWDQSAEQFATATVRAQFAAAGAPDAAPVESSTKSDEETETSLEGGPNVVDGVPDRADHVVDMTAVAFEPKEITIQAGETVAWQFAGGEPHSVTAYEEAIPDDAPYWASGGFEGESAAREGWEDGRGAVQDGESYVRTFDTPGTHEYLCTPHEAAGMVGAVVVEE